jgi:hypothetical protein
MSDEKPNLEQLLDGWANHIHSGEQILTDIEPVRWVIPQVIPADMVTGIYGAPGSGKSYVALTLALELARAGFWDGLGIPNPFHVLYIAGERPSDVRDRLEGWKKHHNREIPAGFYLWPHGYPQLSTPGIWKPLSEFMNLLGCKVVIIDTFARLTLGIDENSSKETGQIMENLERLAQATDGGAVIFVHHSGKDTERGMRGSSAILGAVSSAVAVTGSEGYIQVAVKKSNVGTTDTAASFRLQTVELDPDPIAEVLNTTAVLIPGERPPTRSEDLDAVLEILTNAFNGDASNRQLVEAFTELHRGTSTQSMGRWLGRLQEDGHVETYGNGSRARWRILNSPHAGDEET